MAGRLRALAALFGLLLALLAGAERAAAAETTVGFDGLAPETVVQSQYEAQGLRLGSSKELGAPSPGQGDCGPPTVKEDGALKPPPPSPPKFALLHTCTGAGPTFRGTFGQLLKHPAGQISLYVRQLTVGVPAIPMELIAYDTSGKELGVATAAASSEGWTRVALSTGAAQAGFFLVRTKEAIGGEKSRSMISPSRSHQKKARRRPRPRRHRPHRRRHRLQRC